MATEFQNIKQWGNSLSVCFPTTVSKAVGLQVGQCVQIVTHGQSIIITPCKSKALSLEDRLARFDPVRHGGEVMINNQQLGASQ
jgi:antitoxin MazE